MGLLGAAGLAPLLAGLGVGTLAAGPTVAWLTNMGMNALAGWLGNLAAEGLRAPLAPAAPDAPPDPAWVADVGQRLDTAAAADVALAAELARLLVAIDAVPGALESIARSLARRALSSWPSTTSCGSSRPRRQWKHNLAMPNWKHNLATRPGYASNHSEALNAGYVNLDEDRDRIPCESLPAT